MRLPLSSKSVFFAPLLRAGSHARAARSIACSGRTRTFSSPQPAFCQNPFNAAATRRWREARLRAAPGFSATRPERGGRYPGLICARGRGASSRVVVHPIHSLLRFCSSPCAVRPSGDAADGKSRLLLMPLCRRRHRPFISMCINCQAAATRPYLSTSDSLQMDGREMLMIEA